MREPDLQAWKALNRRVADDLAAGQGHILPAKVLHATADEKKLRMESVADVLKTLVWGQR